MEWPVALPGFERTGIVLRRSALGSFQLRQDNVKTEKASRKNKRWLTSDSGERVEATMHSRTMGFDTPTIEAGGHFCEVSEPQPKGLFVLAALPFFLVLVSGALGALFGALTALINIGYVLRDMPTWQKIGAILATTIVGLTLLFLAFAAILAQGF